MEKYRFCILVLTCGDVTVDFGSGNATRRHCVSRGQCCVIARVIYLIALDSRRLKFITNLQFQCSVFPCFAKLFPTKRNSNGFVDRSRGHRFAERENCEITLSRENVQPSSPALSKLRIGRCNSRYIYLQLRRKVIRV